MLGVYAMAGLRFQAGFTGVLGKGCSAFCTTIHAA